MCFVEFFIGLHEAVHPGQPCLLAMVRVEDDGNSVQFGDFMHVLGSSDTSSNGGLVVRVVDGLSSHELTSTLGEGHHDGSLVKHCSFHASVDGVCSHDVYSGHGKSNLLGVVQQIDEGLSGHDTGLDRSRELGKSLVRRKTDASRRIRPPKRNHERHTEQNNERGKAAKDVTVRALP